MRFSALIGIVALITVAGCWSGLPPERPATVYSCDQAFEATPNGCGGGAGPDGCVTNVPCERFTVCQRCPRWRRCEGADSLVGYPHLTIDYDGFSCDAGAPDSSAPDASHDAGVDVRD
jgi:hypothetical protein